MGAGGSVNLAEQITISHSVEGQIFKLGNFKFNSLFTVIDASVNRDIFFPLSGIKAIRGAFCAYCRV
jgi:hypothetical protein